MAIFSFIDIILLVLLMLTYLGIRRRNYISSLDFFFVFLMLGYGFHACILTPMHKISYTIVNVGSTTHLLYSIGLAIGYLGLILGISLGRVLWRSPIHIDRAPISNTAIARSIRHISIAFTFIFVSVVIAIDGHNYFNIIQENLRYIFDTSTYSYTEIRRTLFSQTPALRIMASVRYAVIPIMFTLLLASIHENRKDFFKNTFIALSMVILTSIQLNKMFFLYYIVITFLVMKKSLIMNNRGIRIRSIIVRIPILIILTVALIYMLYTIQYRNLIENSSTAINDIVDTLIYRIFFATSDNLILWFDAYPKQFPYTGLMNIPFFANLFDMPLELPTVDLPRYYINNAVLTSWQTGFLGSSYASFGLIGILINSIIVGLLVTYWSWVEYNIKNRTIRTCFTAIIGLNSFWLFSSQFHTSLLSGGYLISPILFILVVRHITRKFSYNRCQIK
ncbi:MAG TPA: hypothetical protein DCW68_00925 [Rhodospirillaceae bacterium]|nr:MAG: hypothetical protein A2018_00685 [Alphaproteobacteria bacterium GWF2_58_20]HAU28663.1 hypothetical protein [Rhodospirillaceae bacterium]